MRKRKTYDSHSPKEDENPKRFHHIADASIVPSHETFYTSRTLWSKRQAIVFREEEYNECEKEPEEEKLVPLGDKIEFSQVWHNCGGATTLYTTELKATPSKCFGAKGLIF